MALHTCQYLSRLSIHTNAGKGHTTAAGGSGWSSLPSTVRLRLAHVSVFGQSGDPGKALQVGEWPLLQVETTWQTWRKATRKTDRFLGGKTMVKQEKRKMALKVGDNRVGHPLRKTWRLYTNLRYIAVLLLFLILMLIRFAFT